MNSKNLWTVLSILVLILLNACQSTFEETEMDMIANSKQSHTKRICLSEEHTQSLLKDPEYRAKRAEMMRSFNKFSNQVNLKANCSDPTIVPVAVHYQGVSNPNPSCLQSLAINQINLLNLDYTGENSDIGSWTGQASSSFPGISNGEMCVKFVIADQNHPSGYGLSNGNLAITINRTSGDQVNNWAGYVNIFVQPNTGFLGYAPLGGSGNGDGVVIDAAAFGSGQGCSGVSPEAPYNLGRTLTHEMGHYLLLDHIWGNGCGVDDEVGDTPDQASDYGGCPATGASSCGSTDMHMNYMDYTNDACMYMFSAGQETRMTNFLLSNLGSITSNASNVWSGGGNGGGDGGGPVETCDPPSGLSASNITDNTAAISWSSASGASGYEVRYRISGTNSWTTQSTGSTSINLTSLQSEAQYQVSVRAVCGGTNSSYSANQTFTTTGDDGGGDGNSCESPISATVTIRNLSSVRIDWQDIPDAIRYQVRYKITGTSSWTRKGAANSRKTLNDLQATSYQYQLRTKCPDGWTTWSQSMTFSLEVDGGGSGSDTYRISVTLDDYGSETSWSLYDEVNNLLKSGGPYQDGLNGVVKTKTVDLSDGCYEIDLYDDFGDGICCDYGYGKMEIINAANQVIASSNGIFGTYELISFCVSNGSARIVKRDKDEKKALRGKKKKKA